MALLTALIGYYPILSGIGLEGGGGTSLLKSIGFGVSASYYSTTKRNAFCLRRRNQKNA